MVSGKNGVCFKLNEDGSLKGVITLKEEKERGKKKIWVSSERMVPQMVTRSSGISANFLCDNSKYILGVDKAGSGKRVYECFEAAREKHLSILEFSNGPMATAIKAFFKIWIPDKAMEMISCRRYGRKSQMAAI